MQPFKKLVLGVVKEDARMVTQAIALDGIMKMGRTAVAMTMMDHRNDRDAHEKNYYEKR
jgi:hypothetical protein